MQPTTALSIAGSDSGGGAGIQADLRTFAAFGVHGTTALTAITAQNTRGVTGVANVDPEIVRAQILAVIEDFTVAAVKTGMLAMASTVETVADLARHGSLPQLVVDPVLVSTSGHLLMQEGGVEAYRTALLPLALVVTPNLREACVLCDVDIHDVTTQAHMIDLATIIRSWGPQFVVVKGGHFLGADARSTRSPDVLVDENGATIFDAPRVDTTNDHGTGCSFSAAIAAGIGLGRPIPDAVRDAKAFVLSSLEGARDWRLGSGRGPIDHFGWTA